MSETETNKAAARRYFEEIFPICDVQGLAEVTDRDFVSHGARPDEPPGIEGVIRTMRWLGRTFSDQQWEIHHLVAEGDLVTVHATYRGRHTGEFMGIPPTGREVAYGYVHVLRYRDGKAVEHWSVSDTMTLMQQLGVAQGRPTAAAAAG